MNDMTVAWNYVLENPNLWSVIKNKTSAVQRQISYWLIKLIPFLKKRR